MIFDGYDPGVSEKPKMTTGTEHGGVHEQTSLHVRRAIAGDAQSLAWVVERLSPMLIFQASLRLPGSIRRWHEPEDIASEAWATVLPKLGAIVPRNGRHTPVFLKFLGTTVINICNNLIRKHIKGKPATVPIAGEAEPSTNPAGAVLEATVTDAVRKLRRNLATDAIMQRLRQLGREDQEILVMRCLEDQPFERIGQVLGITAGAAQMRYSRALGRLRTGLPGSLFDELED